MRDMTKKIVWGIMFFIMVAVTGCGTSETSTFRDGRNITKIESTTSVDETTKVGNSQPLHFGVVVDLNQEEKTITVLDINTNGEETFFYSGGTDVRDKYDQVISMSQIELGEIVEAYYVNKSNKLDKLFISGDAWENRRVSNLILDRDNKSMKIGSETFRYNPNLVIISEDKLIELIELNDKDELIVKGYNGYIHSIIISKGHGYISLDNEDFFIDGIVSLGNEIALPIKEDMLIVATEGSYNLQVTKNGIGGTKRVVVKRDQETSIDIGDLKGEAVLMGSISFIIEPVDATLNISGKIYEFDELVELPFGVYKMMVKADGYVNFSGDLVVNETFSRRSIHLASENGQKTETSTTETNITEIESVEIETNNKSEVETMTMPEIPNVFSKINLEEPRGAEAYFDGVYKGVIPVSFAKENGTHSVILKKAGYETKTYSVNIPEGDEDVQLNFPGMTLEKKD